MRSALALWLLLATTALGQTPPPLPDDLLPPAEEPAKEPAARAPPAPTSPPGAGKEAPAARAPGARTAPPTAAYWYGWQILAADAAGLATGLGSAAAFGDLGLLGTGIWAVGSVAAPSIHFAQRRIGVGLGSAGLRMLGPPTLGLFGALMVCAVGAELSAACGEVGLTGGFLAGAVGLAALDAVGLSRIGSEEVRPKEVWYGWQTLLADALALGLGSWLLSSSLADGVRPSDPLLVAAAGMYALGFLTAPILHFAHGQPLKGVADVLMRLALPPLWVLLGLANHCAATAAARGCVDAGSRLGLAAGVLAVAAFDATALAWKPSVGGVRPAPAGLRPVPVVTASRHGASVGLGAAF